MNTKEDLVGAELHVEWSQKEDGYVQLMNVSKDASWTYLRANESNVFVEGIFEH